LSRADDNVHVLRHDDIGPHRQVLSLPCGFHGFDKPETATIFAEQRQSPEAGKGQFMGQPGLIVATDLLMVWLIHDGWSGGGGPACFRGPCGLQQYPLSVMGRESMPPAADTPFHHFSWTLPRTTVRMTAGNIMNENGKPCRPPKR
jgi:hypothetical protein